MVQEPDHISVCVCTYKRPKLLRRLLDRIQKQRNDNLFSYSVVVVDNDSMESAREVVCSFKEEASIPVDYYCEPEQNISLARNMALRHSRGNYIAFIDDDELPIARWLSFLFKAIQEWGADGIQGPGNPHFRERSSRMGSKGRVLSKA